MNSCSSVALRLRANESGSVPVGQQHDADVQSLAQQHVDPAQRRLDAGAVAVVDHRHVPREAADQPDLPFGQRRARGRDDVLDARLVHLDHVGISLDQNAAVLLHDGPLGVIKSVEDVALVVDLRLGRVEVFGDFLVGAHRPAAEGRSRGRRCCGSGTLRGRRSGRNSRPSRA